MIAAGARPFVPPIPGLAEARPLTSDSLWALRSLPRRLVVLGGGPVGCELAQAFARFGSKVTQVEMLPSLMIREDPDVSELVRRSFESDGVDVLVGHKAREVVIEGGEKFLVVEGGGAENGHDTRFSAEHFAQAVAEVIAAHGIKVYLVDRPTPTPVISYAILAQRAHGAVNLTSSHNPPIWGGFKVRADYAGAIAPDGLKQIEALIPMPENIKRMHFKDAKPKVSSRFSTPSRHSSDNSTNW